jgi:hypothetical protein
VQFYLPGKTNGSLHRTTNCELWSHLLWCDNPPSAPSGGRRSCLHTFDWPHLSDTSPGTSLCTQWYTPYYFTYTFRMPTLWQRCPYILPAKYIAQHTQRWPR